jgi:UDP-galactopyranose mutase
MRTVLIISFFLSSLSFLSCKSKEAVDKKGEEIQVAEESKQLKENLLIEGVIKKQGITTYQYGSHILKTEGKFYALRSKTVDLNNYIDQKVKLAAEKIEGYPVSGGPDFLLVKSVELIK